MNQNQNINQNSNSSTTQPITPGVIPNNTGVESQAMIAQNPSVIHSTQVVSEGATVNNIGVTINTEVSNASQPLSQTEVPQGPSMPNINPILKETNKVSFNNKDSETDLAQSIQGTPPSPMEGKREPKKTRSVIPLIIFFIFLAFFIFFLPNINDYFKEKEGKKRIEEFDQQLKEEEEKQKREEEEARKEEEKNKQEEQQYKTMSCVSLPVNDATTIITTTQELTFAGDKLKSVKVTKNTTYQVLDETYNKKMAACESKTIAAAEIVGYEFSCSVSELSIEESDAYDLKKFRSQTLTNSDGTEERIDTEYRYDSSVKSIEQSLTAQGYTCTR